MSSKIIYYLFPLLLLSGIITGPLSIYGLSSVIIAIVLFVTSYSVWNCKFSRSHLNFIAGILLFLILVVLSMLNSNSQLASDEKIMQLCISISFFFCGFNLLNLISHERFINCTIFYLSIVSLCYFYVFQFVSHGDLRQFKVLSKVDDVRIIADYLLFSSIAYPLLFLKVFYGKRDVFFLLIMLISLFCVVLGGRGPLLALSFITALVWMKDLKGSLLMIFMVLIIGFFVINFTGILDTVIARFDSISSGDISLEIRFREYFIALEQILDNPIWGYGVGMSGPILGYGDVYAYPHNILLEAWLELGILGFVILLIIYSYFSFIWIFLAKNKYIFGISLVCLFYLINALKTGSLYEQRYLMFYLGIFLFLRNKSDNRI